MRAARASCGIAVAAALLACNPRHGPAPDAPPVVPPEPRVAPVPSPDAPRSEFEPAPAERAPVAPPAARSLAPERSPSALGLPPPLELDVARRSCVDRELARRRLDSWGDPIGTPRPTPPSDDAARYARILALHPEIGTACSAPRPRP